MTILNELSGDGKIPGISREDARMFRLLVLSEAEWSDADQSLVDQIIDSLATLTDIHSFRSMPGGVHPPQHYLRSALDKINSVAYYKKEEVELERDLAQQAAAGQIGVPARDMKAEAEQAAVGVGAPKLFSSIRREYLVFVNPNGEGQKVDLSPRYVGMMADRLSTFITANKAAYDQLQAVADWMFSVGFTKSRNLQLNRWTFRFPDAAVGEITISSIPYRGPMIQYNFSTYTETSELTGQYRGAPLSRRRIGEQQANANRIGQTFSTDLNVNIRNWKRGHIEELIDTLPIADTACAHIGAAIDKFDPIGDDLLSYTLMMPVPGKQDIKITFPSADVSTVNKTAKKIMKEFRAEFRGPGAAPEEEGEAEAI